MGNVITEHDVWLHLPCANPHYPYIVQQQPVPLAVRRWQQHVSSLRDAVRERLEISEAQRVPATSVLAQRLATADHPCVAWYYGTIGPPPYMVVIGPRSPSEYARRVTQRLVTALAPYVTTVSGMAYGIDTLALQAAHAAGGATIALTPTGVDTPAPRGTLPYIQRQIQGGAGALVSEYVFTTHVNRAHFLHRNRLLAACADLVVIVEAAVRSGTMSTARCALAHGTDVAAIPGDITRPQASGSNQLIRDGAHVILEPQDIAALLDIPWRTRQYPTEYVPLVRTIERGIVTPEGIAEALSLDAAALARLLLRAEHDSIVSRNHFNVISLQQT